MNPPTQIPMELGLKAKDKITGFNGVVVAVTYWLNGRKRITLQPERLNKDGKVPESETFDSQQIEFAKRLLSVAQESRLPGGPYPAPARPRDPKP